jgi:thiamine-monophosphate kinase
LDPSLIARRLLAVNLSDLAAMGAEPAFAFLAISCPPDFDIQRLLSSFVDACERYEVELAGGDLAKNDKVTGSVTLLGNRVAGGRWLQRRLGEPGDSLWIAGDLGLSAIGRRLLEIGGSMRRNRVQLPAAPDLTAREEILAKRAIRRHLTPQPQLAVGKWLASRRRAAAIDVSDGLALDLHRLCRESGVGAQIDEDCLSAQSDFRRLCRKLEMGPRATILSGGEDYALLFSLPPRVLPPKALGCRRIGRLDPGRDLYLNSQGQTEPLPAAGWDHLGHAAAVN